MALKVKIERPTTRRGWGTLIIRVFLASAALVVLVVFIVGSYYYYRYQGIVDARLKQPLFAPTAKIYAAPREVRPGQKLSRTELANELRSAGYTVDGAAQPSPLGTYTEGAGYLSVHPGPQSYHAQDGATIQFDKIGRASCRERV